MHPDVRHAYDARPCTVSWVDQLLEFPIRHLTLIQRDISRKGGFGVIHKFQGDTGDLYIAKVIRTVGKGSAPLPPGLAEHECNGSRAIYNDGICSNRWENITNVYGLADIKLGNGENMRALIMEYIPGPDGNELMTSRAVKSCTDWEKRQIVKLTVHSLLSAVEDGTKANVVHNDIKPGNFLYDVNGRVKLIDFGAWTRRGEAPVITTKKYAAPELYPREELVPVWRTVHPPISRNYLQERRYIKPEIGYKVGENVLVNEVHRREATSSEKSDIYSVGVILRIFLKTLNIHSRNADDLVTQLLTEKPSRRPSATEAKNHVFFENLKNREARHIIINVSKEIEISKEKR